jgi:oxygen-independent coproporphyrinogen-3 oxidase
VLAPPRSLYLHVPFCPHICPYCDFHKMKRHEGLVARYVDQLERDLDDAGAAWGGPLDTLYLGGGTPSHLTDAELTRLMNAVTRNFDLTGALEVTLEADPGTFDAARAAWFKDLGVTRLSIGVQSTQAESLANLGRTHCHHACHALASSFESCHSVCNKTSVPATKSSGSVCSAGL